ncbi:MAG: PEP/pyruvate-binding domain-containing protein [Proteobacteria bacterium]|nr:PEP/pyruvate-binding domain-containing protein [Pseudomonadota bacterium]MBU1582827.1 PEP/pyruvate-binding domain-containing protein [Pseudomonadota bacterium]MBU2451699.1 PEP/pyruvate-binding domain-containing protein [Pseudomonadota bacterium]MBU2631023.1 PEP/pyruvate-binding domain-containing protein [Pseudomonadota bacterium]
MNGFQGKIIITVLLWTVSFGVSISDCAQAQPENDRIQLIQAMKKDPKGPFQAIKWFCPDGKILPAKERCQSPGGRQHGVPKEWVGRLEQDTHIYLNMVLAGVPYEKIWDVKDRHSRIKQYALIQYLLLADDGWIYRHARYYRGAIQAEDESAWGEGFLKWLLQDSEAAAGQFFLVREACRVIPHHGPNLNRLQTIRAVSGTLSDQIPGFMDLRVKIHGQPDSGDLLKVKIFWEKNRAVLDEKQANLFKSLVENLEAVYSFSASASLKKLMTAKIAQIPELSDSMKSLSRSMDLIDKPVEGFFVSASNPYEDMADLLLTIRTLVLTARPDMRLPLMDLSLEIERVLFSSIGNYHTRTLAQLLEKCRILAKAAAGCGYMEKWEWAAADAYGLKKPDGTLAFRQFQIMVEQVRRIVDWGTLMIRSTYLPQIILYSQFEPKAHGLLDDRIRSSVLLPLGEAVGKLTRFAQEAAGVSHQLPAGVQPQSVRGLNPGLAHGILEVIPEKPGTVSVDSKKVYAFKTIPSELKPVAGMLTVSEGNLVSHVQLLARNLGIPNAVISSENLDSLQPYSGQLMFYAVSQRGSVVLKQDSMLTKKERSLVWSTKRSQDLFRVPVEKIDLAQKVLIPLSRIRADDSGRICGPKAANLGQLKFLFPDRVVEGIVIPFGLFREHMDQVMPGLSITFWQFLTKALSNESLSETQLVATLLQLQSAIQTLPFLPGFETALAKMFETTFKDALGNVPVFIRSDTNMEDIPNFTGAGLNLTLFNIQDKEKLFQGIREVWASPYSERSFLWRQKYLENPENVFPSILLLPSVNVDKSGVVITHGIVSNSPLDITAAFNRGAGGAVEGQAAETYLLTESGPDILMYPARQTACTRLPATGGIEKQFLTFDQPILTREDRRQIRDLVKTVRRVLPGTPGIEGQGPFDIELGFINGSMRLFQARPFVENKRAGSLNYLLELDQGGSGPGTISMDQALEP